MLFRACTSDLGTMAARKHELRKYGSGADAAPLNHIDADAANRSVETCQEIIEQARC